MSSRSSFAFTVMVAACVHVYEVLKFITLWCSAFGVSCVGVDKEEEHTWKLHTCGSLPLVVKGNSTCNSLSRTILGAKMTNHPAHPALLLRVLVTSPLHHLYNHEVYQHAVFTPLRFKDGMLPISYSLILQLQCIQYKLNYIYITTQYNTP